MIIALRHIKTISVIEAKMLMRSFTVRFMWVLFLLITALFIVIAHLDGGFSPRVPGVMATKAYFWFSLIRMLLSSFIAPVFVHNDNKQDTFQSLSPRPFFNISYTFGKFTGFTGVMLLMDYICMLLLFVSAALLPGMPLSIWPFLLYPLIITVPLCVFLFGVNVFVARIYYPLVYAVPIVMLMVFLPLEDMQTSRALDLGAITLPLAYSAITGFYNMFETVLQRLIYVFSGIGLVLAANLVMFLKRRSGTRNAHILTILAILVMCFSVFVINLINNAYLTVAIKQPWKLVRNVYRNHEPLTIHECDLEVTHIGPLLDITAHLKISNPNDKPLGRLYLRESKGSDTYDVSSNSGRVKEFFNPDDAIAIDLTDSLRPGERMELDISYYGNISATSEFAAYYHIPESALYRVHRSGLTTLGKRYAYIEDDYVLLPAEVGWYPTSYPKCDISDPAYVQRDLTRFSLTVTTRDGLLPISQGRMTELGDNTYRFEPEAPLTQISLTIGPYQKASVNVDDIEYSYYWIGTFPFRDAGVSTEELEDAIRQRKQHIDTTLQLEYPFKRYQIVETPIHFFGHHSPIDISGPYEQPEIRFIPESSVSLAYYFKPRGRRAVSKVERLTNGVFAKLYRSDYNSSILVLKTNPSPTLFLLSTLQLFMTDPFVDYSNIVTQYMVFPRGHISSDSYFNLMALSYLRSTLDTYGQSYSQEWPFQKVHYRFLDRAEEQFLSSKNLKDILTENQYYFESAEILKRVSGAFFKYLAARSDIAIERIEDVLYDSFLSHESDCLDELSRICNADVDGIFHEFLEQRGKAYYDVDNIRITRHQINGQELYNLRLDVSNPTPYHGFMTFRFDADINSRESMEISIAPHTKKEVGFVSLTEPVRLSYHWFPGGSNDSRILRLDEPVIESDEATVLDSVLTIDAGTVPKEVIVDNLDDGCRVVMSKERNPIRRMIERRAKDRGYIAFSTLQEFKNPPEVWTPTKYVYEMSGMFYGKYNSCYCTKSGDGESLIEYTIPIPEAGLYEVYLSVPSRTGSYGGLRMTPFEIGELGDTTVLIAARDNIHEVTIDITATDDDWALVGTYAFADTAATIQITDESSAGMVIADAVKLREVE